RATVTWGYNSREFSLALFVVSNGTMRMIVSPMLAILLAFLLDFCSHTNAIVCEKDICAGVRCEAITYCSGKLVKNGGICWCCDLCVNVLNPGESCYLPFFQGVPSLAVCPDNYICDP
ncbi:unnamed protein product, partial [Lymnaea stagnalis]